RHGRSAPGRRGRRCAAPRDPRRAGRGGDHGSRWARAPAAGRSPVSAGRRLAGDDRPSWRDSPTRLDRRLVPTVVGAMDEGAARTPPTPKYALTVPELCRLLDERPDRVARLLTRLEEMPQAGRAAARIAPGAVRAALAAVGFVPPFRVVSV